MARQPANRPTKTNYEDYLIDFSNADFGQPQAETPESEEPGFWSKLGNSGLAILEGLTMLPSGVVDTVRDTWNGGDLDVTDREDIEARRRREEEKEAYQKKWDGKAFEGVAGAMVSVPYSLTTLGATIGAGAAGSLAGPVGAGAAGLAASGAVAYRATKHDFLRRLYDQAETAIGRAPTQEEWNNIASEFESEANRYGAWEAIPEAVGNMLFLKLLGPLGKKFMQEGIAKTAGRIAGAHAEEQATETATQWGQGAVDADMEWRENAPTVGEAWREQAPATFWQTLLMGAGKRAADYAYNKIAQRKGEVEANADETQGGAVTPALPEGQPVYALPLGQNIVMGTRETGLGPIAMGSQQAQMDSGQTIDLVNTQETQPQQNPAYTPYNFPGIPEDQQPGRRGMAQGLAGQPEIDNRQMQPDTRPYEFPDITGQVDVRQSGMATRPYEFPNITGQGDAIGGIGAAPVGAYNSNVQAQPYVFPNITPEATAQPVNPIPTQSQITNTQAAPRADTLAAAQNLGLPAPEALPQQAAMPEAGRPIPLGPALQDTRNLNPIAMGSTPIVQNQGENAPNTPQQPVTPQESQSTNDVRETEATETPKPKEPESPQDFLRNHVIVASSPFYGSSAEGTAKEQSPAQEKGQDKAERKSHGVIPTKAGEVEVYSEGGHVFVGDRRMTPDEAKEIINKAERKYGWNAVADQTGPVKKAIKSIEDDERRTFRGELAEYIDGEIAAGRRLNQNDVFKRANEILNTQKPRSITGNDAKAHSRQMIHDLLVRAMKREAEKGGDNLEQRLQDILNLAPSVITADRMKSLKAAVTNSLNQAREQREKESASEGQSDAASTTTSGPINWENTINEDRISELSQSELNMINNMFNKKEAAPTEEAPTNETPQDNAETGEKPLEQWSRGALLAELGGGKEHRKDSKPELVKAVRELRQKRERKPLGKNSDGETVYIDGYGVRHLDPKNYISSQPAPEKGQNWDDADGLYNRGEEGRRFLTAEELAEGENRTEANQSSEARENTTKWDGKENPREFLGREIGPFVADAYKRNDLSLQDTISEANTIIDRNMLPISPQEVAGIAESAIYGEIYDRVMAEAKKGGANLRNRLDSIYNKHPNGMDARKLNSLRKFIDSVEDNEQQPSSNAGNMAVESGQGQERENGDSGQTRTGTGNTQGDRVEQSLRPGGTEGQSVSGETDTDTSTSIDGRLQEAATGEAGRGNRRSGRKPGKRELETRIQEGNSEQSDQQKENVNSDAGKESAELAERPGGVGSTSGSSNVRARRDMGGDGRNDGERGNVSGLGGQESEVKEGAKNYHAPLGALERKGSWKETAARNLDIIELSKRLEAENREATPEEQALLAQYTGWGPSEIRNNLFRAGYGSTRREINPYAAPQDWRPLAERAKELLTQEEVETAFQSTQYAHYTSETMIRSIWKALEQLGFKGGKILEPGMGTGLFAVAAPADIMNKSRYTGVEMDKSTARIARYILPESDIVNADFTKKKLPNDFFDLAIGNPPFADIKILNDPAYKKYRFTLHDYFFAKGLDKVRPGGLLVFVTSKGTMDKQNDKARSFMADRADLIGAIRLPQTAFKQNAGTEVVTDVLFLRKREKDEQPAGESWQGLKEVNMYRPALRVKTFLNKRNECGHVFGIFSGLCYPVP